MTQVDGTLKVFENPGAMPYLADDSPSEFDEYFALYEDYYQRCGWIESSLDTLKSATGYSYFPAIIGRRPASAALNETPRQGKENIIRTANSPTAVSYKKNWNFIQQKLLMQEFAQIT